MASGGLTIKDVNDLLDRLASAENRCTFDSVSSLLALLQAFSGT
jgi:hypothetical protein